MKKLLVSVLLLLGSFSMASAEVGVKIGVSGNIGLYEASGFETDVGPNATEKNVSSDDGAGEHLGAMASVFVEKTLGFLPGPLSRLSIGLDHVPHEIKTGTSGRTDTTLKGLAENGGVTHHSKNTASATLKNINTLYLTANITDWLYIKAGLQEMDVISTEVLNTGSAYGNLTIDGTVIGLGVQTMTDNGFFARLEVNQTEMDGGTLVSSNNDNNSITLSEITGTSARFSVGKSF
jgi:hypothetical protein